jgi:hypothetical protein
VFRRSSCAAVPHRCQHRKDELFQEGGLSLAYAIQHLGSHGGVRFIDRGGNRLTRSRPAFGEIWFVGLPLLVGTAFELDELGELR